MLRARLLEIVLQLSTELGPDSHSKAFADELIILTRGDTVVDAENYMNLEVRKIMEWATSNKLMLSNIKLIVMLMSRKRRREKER